MTSPAMIDKNQENSMLEKIAMKINKVMQPVSRISSNIGMAFTILLVIVVVVSVFSRRFFDMPLKGVRDISVISFSIMVFLPMAWCAIKDGHISMDILTTRFPRLLQSIIGTITLALSTVIMAVLTWQLYVYGVSAQDQGQATVLLSIPYFPFMYLGALGMTMMTVVFFAKFLISLGKFWRKK